MEALTRLVTDSLVRHGLDRPVDPRRLQWSRWFRCDSPHSLLIVPSKPGIFALAEEVAAFGGPSEPCSRNPERSEGSSGSDSMPLQTTAPASEGPARRMLAVLQFSEDDDMAFVLDRMFTRINPMRSRLASGRCFLRFVVIEDQEQRRSICAALNQWLLTSAEKATGIGAEFSSSLELNMATAERVGTCDSPVHGDAPDRVGQTVFSTMSAAIKPLAPVIPLVPKNNAAPPEILSRDGAARNLHCPHPLPSGF